MAKKPILQGELDGLCGLYSVINALNNMLPANAVNDDIRKEFFEIGIKHLDEKAGRLQQSLLEGIYANALQQLIHAYKPYIEENFGYILTTKLITKNDADIKGVWNNISLHLEEENSVVIVPFGDDYDHWSMIMRATEKTWFMIDSDGRKEISKKDLTTSPAPYGDKSICITKNQVLGLSLRKVDTA